MQSIDLSNLQMLKLPRLGQLGFIVRDIPASMPAYARLYNLDTWFEPKYQEREFIAGGLKIELEFQIAYAFSGKVQVELVQAPAGENIYAQYLAQSGEGLHHLGFYLSDLDRRMAVADEAGLSVLLEGRLKFCRQKPGALCLPGHLVSVRDDRGINRSQDARGQPPPNAVHHEHREADRRCPPDLNFPRARSFRLFRKSPREINRAVTGAAG